MSQVRFWCVVPAAGAGTRFGGDLPKQYCQLDQQSVLDSTLSVLFSVDLFTMVVVVVSREDLLWHESRWCHDDRVLTTTGGRERCDSVVAGLACLADHVAEGDWVMVHDAARPCVAPAEILELADTVTKEKIGGILATPVADTLKRVSAAGVIQDTIDRSDIWRALTPQCFRYTDLVIALADARRQGLRPTDEAAAMELAGFPVRAIAGSSDNLKITTVEDLALARRILLARSREQS